MARAEFTAHGSADDPSSIGAPDATEGTNAPLWMTAPVRLFEGRRGATPAPSAGLSTFLFLGMIGAVVAGAGLFAIAKWGPEKTGRTRTQIAMEAPSPPVLPFLPEQTDDDDTSTVEARPVAASEPAPASSGAPSGEKPKSASRASTKKSR